MMDKFIQKVEQDRLKAFEVRKWSIELIFEPVELPSVVLVESCGVDDFVDVVVDSESFSLRQNDRVLLQVLGGHVPEVWNQMVFIQIQ